MVSTFAALAAQLCVQECHQVCRVNPATREEVLNDDGTFDGTQREQLS